MKSFALSSKLVNVREGESYYHKTLKQKGEHNSSVLVILHDSLKYHKLYQVFALQLSDSLGQFEEIHFLDFPGHGLSPGIRFFLKDQHSLSLVLENFLPTLNNKRVIWFAEGIGASSLLLLSLKKPLLIKENHQFIILNPFLYPTSIFPHYLEEKIPANLTGLRLPKIYYKNNLEYYKNDFLVGKQLTLNLWQVMREIHRELKDYSYFLPNDYLLLLNKDAQHIDVDKVVNYFLSNPSKKNSQLIDSFSQLLYDDKIIEKVCKEIKKWLD